MKKPLILHIDGIPEGIIGIVAGRIAEHAKCPCIILTGANEGHGILKGSVRSYGDVKLFNMIQKGAEFLVRFGGHKEAAGLSLKESHLESFQERIYSVYHKDYGEMHTDDNIYYDLEADGEDEKALHTLLEDIQKYGPYGQGNPQPVLFIKRLLLTPMKSGYYRYIGDRTAVQMSSKELDCISFHDVEQFERIGTPALIDVIGTSSVSHYMGNSKHRLEFSYYKRKPKDNKESQHPSIPDRNESGRTISGERIRKVTGGTQ